MFFSKREILGWVVGAIMAVSAIWYIQPTTPYTNVLPVNVSAVEDGTLFVANFEKTQCQFRRLTAIGDYSGIYKDLDWYDPTDKPDDSEDHDRDKGYQTLTIVVKADIDDYSWIEIRTRHFCPDPDGNTSEFDDNGNETRGDYVDGVFYRITIRDLQGYTS